MDGLEYRRHEGKNLLVMKKRLRQSVRDRFASN
jgi:hypothetical protein